MDIKEAIRNYRAEAADLDAEREGQERAAECKQLIVWLGELLALQEKDNSIEVVVYHVIQEIHQKGGVEMCGCVATCKTTFLYRVEPETVTSVARLAQLAGSFGRTVFTTSREADLAVETIREIAEREVRRSMENLATGRRGCDPGEPGPRGAVGIDPKAVHEVKTLPCFFEPGLRGLKPFEVRRNDRNYQLLDRIREKEWTPDGGYTGRVNEREIVYILDNPEFCKEGYVILGLREVDGHG